MLEKINLDSPPSFFGLDELHKVDAYSRHLPYWRVDGATYFTTFRLADSLPQEKLVQLRALKASDAKSGDGSNGNPKKKNRQLELVDWWFYRGVGSCHFKNTVFAEELERAILHFQNKRYFVSCFVIMPNHCHMIIRPLLDYQLEKILGSIKGVVARFINKRLGVKGAVWQAESYDRVVRDVEHLYECVQYIGKNPQRANLPETEWRRWIVPEWESCGWGFRDG